jgi:hypothetical protein
MHDGYILFLLDLLPELFQLVLMTLLKLDLDQSGLILEVRDYDIIPLVEQLTSFSLVCGLQGPHLCLLN